jgi:hypothetical protein
MEYSTVLYAAVVVVGVGGGGSTGTYTEKWRD